MPTIDPITNPGAFDYVIVNGVKSPGVASVEGCDEPQKWDEAKSKGTTGGKPKYNSADTRKPKITLTLWDSSQFSELDNFLSQLRKSPDAKEPSDLVFEHPFFTAAGITACVVTNIGQLKPEGGGKFTIQIDLLESRKEVANAGAGGTPGDPVEGGKYIMETFTNGTKALFAGNDWSWAK